MTNEGKRVAGVFAIAAALAGTWVWGYANGYSTGSTPPCAASGRTYSGSSAGPNPNTELTEGCAAGNGVTVQVRVNASAGSQSRELAKAVYEQAGEAIYRSLYFAPH